MTRSCLAVPLLLLPSLALAGCSDPAPTGPVEIRVRNASAVVLEDVVIGFPEDPGGGGDPVEPGDAESGEVSYGTIEPGEATAYRTIARAYRYAAARATVDGEEAELIPIDYVGEELLVPGRYTYELHYEDGSLGITLARD